MDIKVMIFRGVAQNVCLLLALFYLNGFTSTFLKSASKQFQGVINGIVFAVIASLYMLMRVDLVPGIILDGRAILTGIAGAYGGMVTGMTAAVLISVFRLLIGDSNVILASLVTFGSALIGIYFWKKRKSSALIYSPWILLLLGVLLALQTQLWILLLSPSGMNWELLRKTSLFSSILYPFGTLLLGLLLNRSEYQIQLKNKLIQSEEKYQTLFREMIDAFALHEIICDDQQRPVDYRFLAVNPAFERLTGLNGASLVGRTVMEAMPNTEAYWIETYGKVALTGEPVLFENYAREMGRYYQVTAFRPAPNQFASIFEDVTDRKNAEKALWDSTERFQKIFNSQLDAIFVLNTEEPARIIECNQAAVNTFGYGSAEMMGKTIEMLYVDKSQCRQFGDKLSEAIRKEGCLLNLEFSMKRKDGRIFPSENTVMELKRNDGERSGWVHVVRDLTERKEMEARLRQAQRLEAIGTLAGGIAHDFNNILSPIIGMAEMLLEDLPADSVEYDDANEIFNAGKRGSELVKQILAFSRQTEHQLVPVRLKHTLHEVLKLVRPSIPTDIKISSDISNECGLVMADPTQMHQIAMNLITNAYHAVESSGGEIAIGLKQVRLNGDAQPTVALPEGRYAKLVVSDNGHGIEPDLIDKIFNPYFTTKEQGKGTGLGLAVVYGIVKNHGGDIAVESNVGNGTTFTVWLPVMERFSEPEHRFEDTELPTGDEHILLVDDETQIAKLERKMLEKLGYRVTERTSSVEALEAFKGAPETFDLVVTDMTMPNMTGDRLARELMRQRENIPIIICTGFSERISPEKAESIGIKGFLMKPLIRNDLAHLIRKVLDEGGNGRMGPG